jgi:uncharacterized protein with HEPN domain
MVSAAESAIAYLNGVDLSRYLAEDMIQAAVERRLLTLGEAASRISRTFRDAHPQIPWQDIIKQRHIFVHVYDRINNRRTWDYVTDKLPPLVAALRLLMPPPPTLKDNS